jgi:hypothetical protein
MTNSLDKNLIPLPKTRQFTNGHAIVIAVANYHHINRLPEAVLNDARDIASVLTSERHCGYEPKNLHLLLDTEATLPRVRTALLKVANAAGLDDTIVIFFSGHGAVVGGPNDGTSALLTVDTKLDEIDQTSLMEAEFSAALHRFKARRLLVLLDACHSGGAGSFKAGQQEPLSLGYSEKALTRLAQGTGRVLIASSRASETSLVLSGWQNSVFSHYLLEALRGEGAMNGDGVIRVFEIFNYVAQRVAHEVPGRQHPIFKASDLEDNFPVALCCEGAKRGDRFSLSSSIQNDPWSGLEDALVDLYPTGPSDQEIWLRAGGDLSQLRLSSTGRANWFAALRTLKLGGGGTEISRESLINTALKDYPHHPALTMLLKMSLTKEF